ncbi:MAG: alpha-2-macroglobulin family protein [Gammaproteobacteria bacterium]|nr:alpha-2-macroglobulin family protein [Gammaproteobacteria bacterium]
MGRIKLLGLVIGLVFLFTGCDNNKDASKRSGELQSKEQNIQAPSSKDYSSPLIEQSKRDQLAEDYSATPFKVIRIAEQTYDQGPALAVTFSVPIDPQLSLAKFIQLSDEKNQPVAGDWILGEQLNVAYYPFIEPNTQYRVKVLSGLPAINGRLLEKEDAQTIKTQSSQRNVRFTSHGSQLSLALSDGLSIEAINVPAVDIDFHRVTEQGLSQFINDYLGNNYYELRRLTTYAELVFSGRYDLNYTPNRRRSSLISLQGIEPLEQPGIYIAVMKGAGEYPYEYQVTWFSISDLGFQTRQLAQQTIGFVHNVENAKPVSDVQVRLINRQGKLLSQKSTNAEGFVEFGSEVSEAALAVAQKDQHFSLVKLNSPAMDLTEFGIRGREQRPLELFLYSARDLYRPGETITISGLLRDNDARLIDEQSVKVEIKRPDGRVFQSFTWRGDKDSYYQHDFTPPKNTLTGEWRFIATLGNKDQFDYRLQVEDFLPERMKLSLQQEKDVIARVQKLKIDIQGDYLYGAPAANNRVEAFVTSRQARTISEKYKEFIFGVENYREYDSDRALPAIKLNDKGFATIELENFWITAKQPLRLNTRVSLFESGGRPVSRNIDTFVWPADELVGVRPTWEGDIATPQSDATIELINLDQNDNLQSRDDLTVTLIREDASYYWQWNDGWSYQTNDRNVPVMTRVISLEKDQRFVMALPVEYGHYRVEVTDRQQNLLSSYKFFAGWRWDRAAEGSMGRPDIVELKWDKQAYEPNSTAKLSLNSPYDGTAVITVESNQLLWQSVAEVKNNTAVIDIPINQNWQRHDIYATANVIRAGEAKNKHLPKRAFGLLHLPLDRSERFLDVSLTVPEKMLPETELTTKVQVTGAKSDDVSITLAAVDTGVLSISNFKAPKPFDWFFEPRTYTSEIHDTWGKLIEQLTDKTARLRFGGDGDQELSRGGDAPVSDVQIVSLFSGKISLDDKGEAEIRLPVPYFNGELKLMAVAFSDNAYGHKEQTIKVAAPLVTTISTPRFLGYGDKTQATFELRNMTDKPMALELVAQSSTELGEENITSSVNLEPEEKHIVQLPLSGEASAGSGQINLTVEQLNVPELEKVSLARQWILGLRSPYAAEWRQFDAVIKSNETYQLPKDFNQGLAVSAQHLLMSVSPRPPFNASEHLQSLMQYPYGCLEQTTSRAWPLLLASDEQLFKYDTTSDKRVARDRMKLINDAIARILSMQRGDGSFGLWSNQSNENHWLTVFASDFLLNAKTFGFSVDANAIDRAMKRLQRYLTTRNKMWSENQHYSSWPDHYHVSYRAYAAYVLAKHQQLRLGDVRSLYDNYHKDAKTSLPLAYLAIALEKAGDNRRAAEAWSQALTPTEREQGYAGDYGSAIRDLALTTALATQSQLVKDPWALIFTLRDQLKNRRWLSTQERFALFSLAQQFSSSDKTEWTMEIEKQNDKELITSTQDWIAHFMEQEIPASLKVNNQFEKPLYLSAKVQGYPTSPPKPESKGIKVKRTFYRENGSVADLSKIQTGDLVIVRVDVQADQSERIPEGLIVELLPAGFELENQNLEAAVKIDQMKVGDRTIEQWLANAPIAHQEFRDDRYVAAISLFSNRETTVFYLVRAVTPGTFKVPPSQVEDMYRPYLRAIGDSTEWLTISPK